MRTPMTSPLQPYRVSARDDERSHEDPPVDLMATRTLGWLSGGFHAFGMLGLVTSAWLAAFAGTSLLVRFGGSSDEPVGFMPWMTFGIALSVTLLSHGSVRVGEDLTRGHRLTRCRLACGLVALLGPFGLVLGAAGLIVLFMPRFVRLFES